MRCWGLVPIGLATVLALPAAGAPPAPRRIEDTYAEHTRAVELGRAGHHDAALLILRDLLAGFPDDYPLNRDFILVSTWKGDCQGALERFERVRQHPRFEPYFVQAVADCAVRRAQAGDHDGALAILGPLAERDPENYPLQRDIVVITAWKGDCPATLRRFDALPNRQAPEPYFAVAVADCLLDAERPREAVTLVRKALENEPGNESLRHALEKAQLALVPRGIDHPYREIVFEVATDETDQGLREWRSRLEVSDRLAQRTRIYARYLHARSDDPEFSDGNLNRAGLGLRHRFDERWFGEVEVSGDTQNSGQGGTSAQVVFEPRDTWRFNLAATSFAEDLPLRARAAGVEADRREGGAEYNSLDHVWHWRASANSWDFTDTNRRDSLYTTVGYAYEMLPYREQRLYGEWYQSRNTLDGAPYFNPSRDRSLGIVHRTDFILSSRYKRHVDSLYLALAAYDQEDFDVHNVWSVKYEQDYDFDDFNRLNWGVGYGRNVYDGESEYVSAAHLRYARRF
jgi:tetratricopeptide (TPR) repeat protein